MELVSDVDSMFVQMVTKLLLCYAPFYIISRIIHREDYWNFFTRIGSTVNAIACIYTVILVMQSSDHNKYYNLFEVGDDYVVNSFYWFVAYLFVDGLFHLPSIILHPSAQSFLSLIHHFVGGLGIYLIANKRLGMGLGVYFAWTEVSTPLLNLSWILYTYQIKNIFTYIIFGLFYAVFLMARILTIPILINYIFLNYENIHTLTWSEYIMAYGGPGTLASLNIIWSIMLTKKAWGMITPKSENKKE